MNCSTEFILVYNDLFKFLDDKGGFEFVEQFWALLSDVLCQQLVTLAKTKGVAGCAEYWMETLSAEDADFRAEFIKTKDGVKQLNLFIYQCPSHRKMKECNRTPYFRYCEHCLCIYERALQRAGLTFECVQDESGSCRISVREKK